MAFAQEVKDNRGDVYRLSPNLKRYTLTDLGFFKNNAGAYLLKRALEPNKALEQSISLKMSVSSDLSGFKLNTLSAGDVVAVNIFKNQKSAELSEVYDYFIEELLKREVLVKDDK